jgi:hypothetical protein
LRQSFWPARPQQAGQRIRKISESGNTTTIALPAIVRDGKGGIYVDFLKSTPPDLTQLTKANGGVFPLERVYGAIDGRQQVKSHGTREMPIWGRDYQIRAGEHYYADVIYDSDAFVRASSCSIR